ncbi:MAG TPA: hypothetical protein VHO69_12405, partial [Phototrophicaceae bacterium]|nr:hypothetical protein [Phototrophicaceae bacterium]
YLHELRTYMLSVLLLTIVLWAYSRLLQHDKPGRFLQAGFVLSIGGLLYTHYSIALALGVVGLYHLLFVQKNHRWWRITGLMALGGALFLPWIGVILEAFRRFGAANTLTHDPGLAISELLARTSLFFSNGALGLLALVGILALWSLRVYRRKSLAVWFWTLTTLVVVVVVNERTALIKFGRERYLLVLWPLLALLGGLGLASLGKTRLKLAAPLLLGLWLIIGIHANVDGTLMRDTDSVQTLPWDTLAATLAQQAQAGDVVALHDTTYNWVLDLRPAEYYLYGLPVRFTMLEALPGDTLTAAAQEFVGNAPQVWVGIDKRLPTTSRLTDFTAALAGQYAACGPVFDLPRLRLDLYRRFPASAFQPEAADWHFGAGIAITNVDITPPKNGQPLKVQLVWAVSADVPPYTYSVGLHLLDDTGQLVQQADYGLPSEAFACRQTAIPTADLPPGDYQLRVMVYNWSTGERLTGRVTTTGETGERLLLETVTTSD